VELGNSVLYDVDVHGVYVLKL